MNEYRPEDFDTPYPRETHCADCSHPLTHGTCTLCKDVRLGRKALAVTLVSLLGGVVSFYLFMSLDESLSMLIWLFCWFVGAISLFVYLVNGFTILMQRRKLNKK